MIRSATFDEVGLALREWLQARLDNCVRLAAAIGALRDQPQGSDTPEPNPKR